MATHWYRGPIVLVEDDENDVFFVRESLTSAKVGNPLIVYDNPLDARRDFQDGTLEPPVLFILDVNFRGGMSGIDFLRWVREQPEPFGSTPAMILTGSDKPEDHHESLDLNALQFLKKPPTSAALARAVQALGFVVVTNLPSGELGLRIIQRG